MQIRKISTYHIDLPMKEGAYIWSNQSFSAFDSTVVVIETDEGICGAGETCPLGPAYLPAFAEGARTAIAKLAPELIGRDPTQIGKINRIMDTSLKGHPYAKSAIDMACWDIFGKSVSQPVYALLGGKQQDAIKLFKVISRDTPDRMSAKLAEYQRQGFRQFQIKVGEDPDTDIQRIAAVSAGLKSDEVLNADANTGWMQHQARRVAAAVQQYDFYVEQPCLTYGQCRAVRNCFAQPMILDECMDSVKTLIQGFEDHAMDAINLKINRVGGLTKACLFRELCIEHGILMTVEDSWGGEIATAAIAHLAHTLPSSFHFQSSAFHEYTHVQIALGAPKVSSGFMFASDRPGLGTEPDMTVLGEATFATAA